jgi:hypothetical protein
MVDDPEREQHLGTILHACCELSPLSLICILKQCCGLHADKRGNV